jgi:hypothetical protein
VEAETLQPLREIIAQEVADKGMVGSFSVLLPQEREDLSMGKRLPVPVKGFRTYAKKNVRVAINRGVCLTVDRDELYGMGCASECPSRVSLGGSADTLAPTVPLALLLP